MNLNDFLLDGNAITDITPLKECSIFRRLSRGNNPITTIEALSGQPLQQLNLSDTMVTELPILTTLTKLEYLNVSRTPAFSGEFTPTFITDISWMAGCELQELNLTGNRVRDISPLQNSTIYDTLNLEGNPLRDISAIKDMPLRKLNISGCQIRDYSVLRVMKNLSALRSTGPSSKHPHTKNYPRLTS